MSVHRGEAEIICSFRVFRILTQNRHGAGVHKRRFQLTSSSPAASFALADPATAVRPFTHGPIRAMNLRTIFLIACTGLAMSFAGCLPASAATRHIVLLFDERVELPGLSLMDAELVRTLRSDSTEPIEVYREAMDLSRFSSDSYKTLLRDFLRAKYANKKIDVAVAVMAPAFDFLLTYGDLIFPGTPIVFSGLDRQQLANRSLPPNVYGVLVKREFAFDTRLLLQAQKEFRPYENRVSFTYLTELPLEQLLSTLSLLPSRDIVLYLTLFQDGIDQPFVPHEVAERVSSAASVPVYGFLDQYLGRGIVGGSLYSFTAHGAETAQIVLRLLTGAVPSQKLSEVFSNKVMFDWRQMLRWGISEQLLPSGAEIHFREPTVWETYRWHILVASAVLLIQAALIAGLLYERRGRRYAELQSRQRMSELAHVTRFSTAGELTASISHEINQPLGAILTNVETLQLMLKSPAPDMDGIREIVSDIWRDDKRASEVIQHLRSLLKKAPFEPKHVDLNEIVGETIDFLSAQAVAQQVDLRSAISPSPLPIRGDRIQLQQVILNLIVNAIDVMSDIPTSKRQITIWTARHDEFAQVAVEDAGPGIPPDRLKEVFQPFFTTKAHGMGMGLSIARTIVEAHNGMIWAENQVPKGAVFRIRLPLA